MTNKTIVIVVAVLALLALAFYVINRKKVVVAAKPVAASGNSGAISLADDLAKLATKGLDFVNLGSDDGSTSEDDATDTGDPNLDIGLTEDTGNNNNFTA